MQFGTRIENGKVSFRLWAPAAKQVDLLLPGVDRKLPMNSSAGGWFTVESSIDEAKIGDKYQFVIDKELAVPDPASRYQPDDVHGASQIVDPQQFKWTDGNWRGKPWETAILYELNVGTFTPEGTFKGVEEKLDALLELGVTAIELMPIADFPGRWGWGYDGVLPYAPDAGYGRPEDLKKLVQSAHAKGLMVFLDVVYNHFGPEGNYLHAYAKKFFTEKHHTPWGAAINYDDDGSEVVRSFFIENALYWLTEFHIDGLRLDAVHAIKDDSKVHVLKELAARVAAGIGAERQIHLVLENEENSAQMLERSESQKPQFYTAQWNDDVHHAFHVLSTGESNGYYSDYNAETSKFSPIEHLGRCLTQGFSYQGQPTPLRNGEGRGEPSGHLPPTAFVSFIQNHDQIGNRAFGDRLSTLASPHALQAMIAVYLLAPSIPMLFMGEEWGSKTPFCYFCDVGPELAPLVTAGRRKEFAKFPEFSSAETRERIPDPCSEKTFQCSKLHWADLKEPSHQSIFQLYKKLIEIRKREVIPLINSWTASNFATVASGGICASWKFGANCLTLLANMSDKAVSETDVSSLLSQGVSEAVAKSKIIYSSDNVAGRQTFEGEKLLPWSVIWLKS